jgi:hypothetical protein
MLTYKWEVEKRPLETLTSMFWITERCNSRVLGCQTRLPAATVVFVVRPNRYLTRNLSFHFSFVLKQSRQSSSVSQLNIEPALSNFSAASACFAARRSDFSTLPPSPDLPKPPSRQAIARADTRRQVLETLWAARKVNPCRQPNRATIDTLPIHASTHCKLHFELSITHFLSSAPFAAFRSGNGMRGLHPSTGACYPGQETPPHWVAGSRHTD